MEDATPLPEHVAANREAWDRYAAGYVAAGHRNWAAGEISWGIWSIPESELRLLPEDLAGKDVIELGCGTAYVSAWLARNAETVPLPDAGFDLAVSEYGASLWAEPAAWVREAARLLRPGGRLVFLTNALLLMLCVEEHEADDPAKERLQRPMFGMHRVEWPDDSSVEFHLPHGAWIDLLRANGFDIERLAEIQAPRDAVDDPKHSFVSADWARKWPSEEAWIARRRG